MLHLLSTHSLNPWTLDIWHAVPAILAVSLVYSATRHEQMRPILIHAGRVVLWILFFMFLVLVLLKTVEWFL